MSGEYKKTMLEIVSGEISDPWIELAIDGKKKVFEGDAARCFAYGVIAGLDLAGSSSEELKAVH